MATYISKNPNDTFQLGESWGRAVNARWLVFLMGPLGAGKTQLVKGIAAGLGIKERIQSPTFGLVIEYLEGRLPLYHLDLYRLDSREQIIRAGLDQYIVAPEGVVVIEWIERFFRSSEEIDQFAAGLVGCPVRVVRFELENEEERIIRYDDFGT
jgi:tRNA threonylcarbamoyladenosine biosynthesis protein TsaE